MSRAALAWRVYAIVALALALLGIGHWIWAVSLAGPVMYGEGAVAHAALLARDGVEYAAGAFFGDASAPRPIFTAANYPPLYFSLASFGDPFVTGRIESIIATLFVAGAIAWRARPAGALVAGTLALAWLGSVPVLQWGAAVKPDLVALALTVAAVTALDARRPHHMTAGAFLALAVFAKPTALLPALAILVFVVIRSRSQVWRGLATAAAVGVVGASLSGLLTKTAIVHVVSWNALPWSLALLAPLLLLALVVLAVAIVTLIVTRPSTTVVTAYLVGALGVLLLGGREGATINYMLDLSAAVALGIAGRAPRLATSTAYPVASILGAAVAILLVNPFGIVPGRGAGPGAWGDPARIGAVGQIPGTLLVEDSGLLVANGREPIVDDLFLWSRNRARQWSGEGFSFLEGDRLLNAIRNGEFDGVVTEVDLSRLDEIDGFERQRWWPELAKAVLDRYPSVSRASGGLFVYRKP